MAFLGKTYTLDKQERFDEFLAAMGLPQTHIDKLIAEKSSYTINKDGDTYSLTAHDTTITFKSGVEFEDDRRSVKAKTTYVVEGNTITNTQKFPNGTVLTYKNVYDGDKLVVTATNNSWDGVAYRYYSA